MVRDRGSMSKRQQAFENTILPHGPALLRTASRLCRTSGLAEDLVQETMLRAWRSFDRFENGTNARAWLYTIMLNHWKRSHRDSSRRIEEVTGGELELLAPVCPIEERIAACEVLSAVDDLPIEQRTVLLLAAVDGLAIREIAGILSIPLGTVMSRLGRARSALRIALASPMGADRAISRLG